LTTAGWTREFRDLVLADVELQMNPLEICQKHNISVVQLNKLLVRTTHERFVRVDIRQALEDYRHTVMSRLPQLARDLPANVKTAEFLRKSAVDLGEIGQPKEPENARQPMFTLPPGAHVAITVNLNQGAREHELESERADTNHDRGTDFGEEPGGGEQSAALDVAVQDREPGSGAGHDYG